MEALRPDILAAFDAAVLHLLAAQRTPMLDHFFIAVTWFGSGWVLLPAALVAAVLLQRRAQPRLALLCIFGIVGIVIITHFAKVLLLRARPELYSSLIPLPLSGSFPSGHSSQIAAACMVAYLVTARLHPRRRLHALVVSIVIAVGVGISRLYLQVHYPTDILGGWTFGILWVALLAYPLGLAGPARTGSAPRPRQQN